MQRDALIAAGVNPRHLHQDHTSGARDDRPGLKTCLTLYAQREETRREHAREIVAALGLRSVRVSDYRMLILAAAREAATTERGLPITRAVIDKLKDKKLLVPAPTQLIGVWGATEQ